MGKILKAIDLFSGAGGLTAGFESAGINVTGSVESVEVFSKTNKLNYKNKKVVNKDIKKLTPKEFSSITGIKKKDIDILIGGPPCQSFSTIGTPKINSLKGKSTNNDPRNYLFKFFFDYINFFKPKVFLLENVPTIMTKQKGKLFENMIDLAENLKYTCNYKVINAVNYGVPQKRKRFFLIGSKDNQFIDFPEITHTNDPFQRDLLNFNCSIKNENTVRNAIEDLPEIYDGIRMGHMNYSKNANLCDYQKLLRSKLGTVSNNVCRMSNDRAKRIFKFMKQGDKYMDLSPEIRKILPFREDIFHDRLKRLIWDEPSWTVIAHIGMDGYMYIHPSEDRTLSVREAARIQSFADDYEFVGNMREQYVQVGNAVPPLLSKALATKIKKYL